MVSDRCRCVSLKNLKCPAALLWAQCSTVGGFGVRQALRISLTPLSFTFSSFSPSFLPFSTSLPFTFFPYAYFIMIKPLEASFVTLILPPRHLIIYVEIFNMEWSQWKSLCFDWTTYGNLMFRHIFVATKQSFHQRIFMLSYWQSCTWWTREDRKKEREGEGERKEGKETWLLNL